jgi:hypothetical protein
MQQKPDEKVTFDQVLHLADQLSPAEQERLVDEIKLQWMRRAVEEGEDSIQERGLKSADEAFRELQDRYKSK